MAPQLSFSICSSHLPETCPDNNRSRWIAPVFQSLRSDLKLYALECSNGNKNTIWSLILTSDRILANRNILYIAYNLQLPIMNTFFPIPNYANDAKTFLKHFSDCLFYFCSTCADCITNETDETISLTQSTWYLVSFFFVQKRNRIKANLTATSLTTRAHSAGKKPSWPCSRPCNSVTHYTNVAWWEDRH